MTINEELREIEERVAGHTPGPWLVSTRRCDGSPATLYIEDGEDEDDMAVFEHWVGDPCYLVQQEKNATLISQAPDILRIARELDAELQEALKLCDEARKAISQGRIAVEDEQNMTAWHVQTAPLQARLEQLVASHKEVLG